jgi:hypothetical protein
MSLKVKWENSHFDRSDNYIWVFIKGRMLVINDSTYRKQIKENYLQHQGSQEEKVIKENEKDKQERSKKK